MKILVTGSAGHLGEGLVRTLGELHHEVVGIDIRQSPFTHTPGSITNRSHVRKCMDGVEAVLHTATLHKPHVATHSRQDFVDVNITGTLNLLEEATSARVRCFIFTSTTSVFGHALVPPSGAPASFVTEDLSPVPKNIYGVTKAAAESLCELFYRKQGLPCIILRTSRFFPEEDDNRQTRQEYADLNVKVNEFLYRRVELEDVVAAHLLALHNVGSIGFGKYIISATTPFSSADAKDMRGKLPAVVRQLFPDYEEEYSRRGWRMFPGIDRVYVNDRARTELGWQPQYDFRWVLDELKAGSDPRSALSRVVGSKGYHDCKFEDGPYPVE
jgi:nucleoside-diphosphate-sugar epimerase